MRAPVLRKAAVSGCDKTEVDLLGSSPIADPGADEAVSTTEIAQHRFRQAWAGMGYREDDVDQWLEAEYGLHTADDV